MVSERDIREHLAANLGLLEKGLRLLAQEYPLKNPDGASGRIDILARDRLDNFVVVELKKSNATSRTAIHELLKYLALLKAEKGLPSEKLRCLLVSTDWNELRSPFYELVSTSPFSIDGHLLRLDASGKPLCSERITPPPANDGLCFPTDFPWLVCSTKENQLALADRLMQLLPSIGFKNVLLVLLTSKQPQQLPFPFSIAVPFFPLSLNEAEQVLKQDHWPISMLRDYADVPAGACEFPRAVGESVQSKVFCLPQVQEVHLADLSTFGAERDLWTLDEIRRSGSLVSDTMVLSDQDILRKLAGTDGANGIELTRAVDPSHKQQFGAFREALQPLLERYDWWVPAERFLEDSSAFGNATVVAQAYSPENLLAHLVLFLRTGDADYLPGFRLMLATEHQVDGLVGRLDWDGTSRPPSATAFVRALGISPDLALVFGSELGTLELLGLLGLGTFSARFAERDTSPKEPPLTVQDWADRHETFAIELCRLFPIALPPSSPSSE